MNVIQLIVDNAYTAECPEVQIRDYSGALHVPRRNSTDPLYQCAIHYGTGQQIPKPLLNVWLNDRRTYVESQGWMKGCDKDRYDLSDRTIHVFTARTGKILAGLRLTPVESMETSLSWGMLTPSMRAQATINLTSAKQQHLWDLTRLMPSQHMKLHPQDQMNALCEVFGAAAMRTLDLSEKGALWLFATTGRFFRIAQRNGLFFKEVCRSQHATLDDQIVFCSIQPQQGIRQIVESQDAFPETFEHLQIGLNAVDAQIPEIQVDSEVRMLRPAVAYFG